MMCTKKSVKLLIASLISITSISNAYNFDPVENHLKMLFCTSGDCNNLNAESKKDFNDIERKARNNVHDSLRIMWFGFASDPEVIQETVKEYVKARAYNHAYYSLKASESNALEVADNIAAMLIKEEEEAELRGTFSQFIGNALEFKTEKLLTEIRRRDRERPKPVQLSQEHTEYCSSTDYSSDEDPCVCCTEIVPKKRRVLLPDEVGNLRKYSEHKMMYQGCGHFLCMDCTQNWFFNQNKNTCPVCRAIVSKSLLRDIISSKNDIATQEALLGNSHNPAREGHSYQPGARYPKPSAPPYHGW